MSALKIKDDQGNWINLPGLKGDKGDKGDKGESGVYLGTTAPSDEDINVWINPNGEAHTEAVVIDPTLTQEGRAADAKVTGDKITGLKEDLNQALSGYEKTFTATGVGTKKFNINIYKNVEYTYTNNTSASTSVNVYDAQGDATSIYGGLGAGKSVTFVASDNYVQIGGYFNATGTVTLTCEGVANGIRIKNNSDAITEQSANIDLLENIASGYSEVIVIATAQASKVHYTAMKKGVMYAIKNNTTGTVLINVYTAENVVKLITSSLAPNDTVKWIAEDDYVRISAYCNNTGTLIFYHDNVYADIIEALTDNDSWIQTVSNTNSGAVSALTVIDKRLYVFPYVSNNGNTTGKIFNIDTFGKLTDSGNTFTSNIGHQNTIDYSKYNRCLLASRYTMADGIIDFSVYVFQNVTGNTNAFDIANAVKLDMSSIGGDTLNAIWAGNNYGRNDLIYVFTRDNTENKQYYSLVQLGKGSNELPNGTIISGVSSSAFNGTYKVLSNIEKSLTSESGVLEYINDACLHNGKIYKCVAQSMGGFAYMIDEIIGFGNAIESKEFLIPQANQIDGVPDIESEGITIHNGYLYIGSYGHGINVFKMTL